MLSSWSELETAYSRSQRLVVSLRGFPTFRVRTWHITQIVRCELLYTVFKSFRWSYIATKDQVIASPVNSRLVTRAMSNNKSLFEKVLDCTIELFSPCSFSILNLICYVSHFLPSIPSGISIWILIIPFLFILMDFSVRKERKQKATIKCFWKIFRKLKSIQHTNGSKLSSYGLAIYSVVWAWFHKKHLHTKSKVSNRSVVQSPGSKVLALPSRNKKKQTNG